MAVLETSRQFDSEATKLATQATLAVHATTMSPVRYEIVVLNMFDCLGNMLRIIRSAASGPRAEFIEVFGDDCRRVANMLAQVKQLQFLCAGLPHKDDSRLQQIANECQALEDLLTSMNLGQALAAAKHKAQQRMATSVASYEGIVKGIVTACEGQQSASKPSSATLRAASLQELEGADVCAEARAIVEALFEIYDLDGNGLLEGEEA